MEKPFRALFFQLCTSFPCFRKLINSFFYSVVLPPRTDIPTRPRAADSITPDLRHQRILFLPPGLERPRGSYSLIKLIYRWEPLINIEWKTKPRFIARKHSTLSRSGGIGLKSKHDLQLDLSTSVLCEFKPILSYHRRKYFT